MPTTTANGLPATAVRGVPNTWIVREARTLYWAITTDGTPISQIDTDMTVRDGRWSIAGAVTRTSARDYDTAEEGRRLAGWYVELHGNSGERYRRADEALRVLKLLIANDHAEQQACRVARADAAFAAKVKAEVDREWQKIERLAEGRFTTALYYMIGAEENADDTAAEQGFERHSDRWYSYVLSGFSLLEEEYGQYGDLAYTRNIEADILDGLIEAL